MDALRGFGDEGRLKRGITYANNGSVKALEINDNQLHAKVRGSGAQTYRIDISFKHFAQREKKAVIDTIKQHPLILAAILNRTLPEQLLGLLQEQNIYLLPRSWSDMKRSCSCPDWGDPCKHMAAVYYIFTSMIDKNPFTLFNVRGLDLLEEFNLDQALFNIEHPVKVSKAKPWTPQSQSCQLLRFDDYSTFITSILADHPPFCAINFRTILQDFYQTGQRQLYGLLRVLLSTNLPTIQEVLRESAFSIKLTPQLSGKRLTIRSELFKLDPQLYSLFDFCEIEQVKDGIEISLLDAARLFLCCENEQGSADYRFLHAFFRAHYLLLESGGFVPVVLPHKKDHYVGYEALRCIEKIDNQFLQLQAIMPPMVRMQSSLLEPQQALTALSMSFIGEYVAALEFNYRSLRSNPPQILQAFFAGQRIVDQGMETADIARSVASWLAVFNLVKTPWRFVLHIEKQKQYQLGISIESQDEQYALCQALQKLDRMQLLKFIALLEPFLPQITTLLEQPWVQVSHEELEHFLLQTRQTLGNIGVSVMLPKELHGILRPKAVVQAAAKKKSNVNYFSLADMLDYEWKVAIGEQLVTLEQFEQMVAQGKELIWHNNTYVRISPQEAKDLISSMKKNPRPNSFELLQMSLSDEIVCDSHTQKLLSGINKSDSKLSAPPTLNAQLRPYQLRGFQWAISTLLNGFGVILADDMGLGKTVQTIAILLHLKQLGKLQGRVLVVAPTSLLGNWSRELERFGPSLSYGVYHGSQREINPDCEVLVTTYNLAMRDERVFKKMSLSALIIDEAQAIKNPLAKTTKAVKSLKANYKIALSGTPVENNLSELWSIFDFTIPKYLKSQQQFQKDFAKDIEISKDPLKLDLLKKITAPFMLRRLKEDKSIIDDLPDKIIIDEYATQSPEQVALYQSMIESSLGDIAGNSGIDRKGLIFKLITNLKQICNHPRNFDKKSPAESALSGKTELLLTLLGVIREKGEKVLIFTQYTEMMDILKNIIERELHTVPLCLHGSMSRKQREQNVDLFQNSDQHSVFILSLKAAGTGLNLTAACNVIHYDLWYNPAVENQATDRAFRIGQKNNVFVHRLITRNSFEEKIDTMIKSKKQLSDMSVAVGENWISEMSDSELRNLLI